MKYTPYLIIVFLLKIHLVNIRGGLFSKRTPLCSKSVPNIDRMKISLC